LNYSDTLAKVCRVHIIYQIWYFCQPNFIADFNSDRVPCLHWGQPSEYISCICTFGSFLYPSPLRHDIMNQPKNYA